jgi:hypothetical protein
VVHSSGHFQLQFARHGILMLGSFKWKPRFHASQLLTLTASPEIFIMAKI